MLLSHHSASQQSNVSPKQQALTNQTKHAPLDALPCFPQFSTRTDAALQTAYIRTQPSTALNTFENDVYRITPSMAVHTQPSNFHPVNIRSLHAAATTCACCAAQEQCNVVCHAS
jgi:hypothetical protein